MKLQEVLSEFSECLAFQNPRSPHLTLMYWKELMEIEYQQVLRQCPKIVTGRKVFAVHITGPATFGDRGNDRILFLQIAFSEELARLKKACPWVSGQLFQPHITLARIRHPQRFVCIKKKVLRALRHCRKTVQFDRLSLYAEVHAAKQTKLADFPFVDHSSSSSSAPCRE